MSTADFRVSGLYISAQSPAIAACWSVFDDLRAAPAVPSEAGALTLPARQSVILPEQSSATQALLADARTAVQRARLAAADLEGTARYWFYRAVDRAIGGADLARELQTAQDLTNAYLACQIGGGIASECARQVDRTFDGVATPAS